MSKLLNYISEYFLGTGTRRGHKKLRSVYREFVLDQDGLEKSLRYSHIQEKITIALRILPDIGDLAYIANYLGDDDSSLVRLLIGLAVTEGLRFVAYKNSRKINMQIINDLSKIILPTYIEEFLGGKDLLSY